MSRILILIALAPLVVGLTKSRSQSVGDDITLHVDVSAIKETARKIGTITEVLEDPSFHPVKCQYPLYPSEQCGEGSIYIPPFPPSFDSDGKRRGGFPVVYDLSWADENLVHDGRRALDPVFKSIDSHSPMKCDDDVCTVAVKASDTKSNLVTLAICHANQIANDIGPPKNCEPIAIRDGEKWLISIAFRVGIGEALMMSISRIEIVGLPRTSILAKLDRAISGAPLFLPDRKIKKDRILAIGPKRASRILSGGWFEWPQILIEVDDGLGVDISLDLLVNKQNTSEPQDWHLPTSQQVEEYRAAVVKEVSSALTEICLNPVWSGSQNLTCRSVRTDDGAIVSLPDRTKYGDRSGENPPKIDPRIVIKHTRD